MSAQPIGSILTDAREEAGLSTAELAKVTRIPRASLFALESGDFETLPAPVFVRGFLRAYCREVDLDPSEVLSRYDSHLHEEEMVHAHSAGPGAESDSLGPLLLVGTDIQHQPAQRGLQISHMLLLLLALVTFVIAYVSAGLPSRDAAEIPGENRASTTQTAGQQASPTAR